MQCPQTFNLSVAFGKGSGCARLRSSECMASTQMDFMVPELREERKGSKLDILEVTHLINGGAKLTEKRRKIC